jgi:hypothetical protein
MNQHLGYATCSADGVHWGAPRMLEGTYGHYIWRASPTPTRLPLRAPQTRIHRNRHARRTGRRRRIRSPKAPMASLPRRRTLPGELRQRNRIPLRAQRPSPSPAAEATATPSLRSAPPISPGASDLGRYIGGPLLARHYWLAAGNRPQPAHAPSSPGSPTTSLKTCSNSPAAITPTRLRRAQPHPRLALLLLHPRNRPDSKSFTAIYMADRPGSITALYRCLHNHSGLKC